MEMVQWCGFFSENLLPFLRRFPSGGPRRLRARGKGRHVFLMRDVEMAQGTIKKLAEKGFGFIDTGEGRDLFFHLSNLDGVSFEDLSVGQSVEFEIGEGPKGPRAENVRPA